MELKISQYKNRRLYRLDNFITYGYDRIDNEADLGFSKTIDSLDYIKIITIHKILHWKLFAFFNHRIGLVTITKRATLWIL